MSKIRITCSTRESLELDELLDIQGNLKDLSKDNRDKLIKSINQEGFTAPFFIWKSPDGKNCILDGNQRRKTLIYMRTKGYEIPPLPVVYIEADSMEHAKIKLLKITSQYGQFNQVAINEWVDEIGLYILDSLRLVDTEIGISIDALDESEDETYTDKINPPIYEPENEKPELSELVDYKKTNELIDEINNSDITDKSIKAFLIASAHRHTVFSYKKIANYYAHASEEIQDLMENSALVIIDFEKAIEKGFVKLAKNIAKIRGEN